MSSVLLRAADEDAGGSVTPLMGEEVVRETRVEGVAEESAAHRALRMGFPSVAVELYARLVGQTDQVEERRRLTLDWVMALLENGQVDQAAEALTHLSEGANGQVRLRRGLIAMARGNSAGAQAALIGVTVGSLPMGERAWFHYLVGAITDAGDAPQLALRAYRDAIAAATSGLQRARFELAHLRSSWRVARPTEAQAQRLRRQIEDYAGEQIGYDSAKRYAAVLAALGRQDEAMEFLQNQLLVLPADQAEEQDDFRLLLGLISGAERGLGRNGLLRLLAEGHSRGKQRIALRMLVQASQDEEARAELRAEVGRLLEMGTHPIEQDLLLFHAQLAVKAEDATRDALALLERFPASDLRPMALSILVSAAWEGKRYRAAAGYAAQVRRELPESDCEVRAQMALLQAEAFFRGGDYRSAAEAYGAAQDERPSGVVAGDLMFQEVLARILDNQLTAAADRIDLLANDPRLDVINRWQAEWNLARALQADDRVADAYARVKVLMAEQARPDGDVLPVELAVRMAWLEARLAFEVKEFAQTLALGPRVRAQLVDVPESLRVEVESSLRLLEAEAQFGLGQTSKALETLQTLRQDFANTNAAVYSYIAEANAQAEQGQLVEAQRLLTDLVGLYPTNRYAPFALYQSALMAEGRREESYLKEAIEKIEQLVSTYPQDELVFYARFKQGDLLRKLNQWGPARQVYELIINQYSQHRDVLSIQMALADTLNAQAGTTNYASLRDSAAAIYERMRDLASAPKELRIEAGLKAGNALQQNGQLERAAETWWQVVNKFLLEESDPSALGTKGRYWMARMLKQLGVLFERQGRLGEARRAYALIPEYGLPEADWARGQLSRLGGTPIEGEVTGR